MVTYYKKKFQDGGYGDDNYHRILNMSTSYMENVSSTRTMWSSEGDENYNKFNYVKWDSFEKYIQRLCVIDQMILWWKWHENYSQRSIGKKMKWSQGSVRNRLLMIGRKLKLLMEPALKWNQLDDIDITDQQKFLLIEYSKCMGSYSHVCRRTHWTYSFVRHRIVNAMRKISPDHPAYEKLTFDTVPIISPKRGNFLNEMAVRD